MGLTTPGRVDTELGDPFMIKSVPVASRIVRVYLASTFLLGELIIVYIRRIITTMSEVYFAGSRMSAAVDDRVERKHG